MKFENKQSVKMDFNNCELRKMEEDNKLVIKSLEFIKLINVFIIIPKILKLIVNIQVE